MTTAPLSHPPPPLAAPPRQPAPPPQTGYSWRARPSRATGRAPSRCSGGTLGEAVCARPFACACTALLPAAPTCKTVQAAPALNRCACPPARSYRAWGPWAPQARLPTTSPPPLVPKPSGACQRRQRSLHRSGCCQQNKCGHLGLPHAAYCMPQTGRAAQSHSVKPQGCVHERLRHNTCRRRAPSNAAPSHPLPALRMLLLLLQEQGAGRVGAGPRPGLSAVRQGRTAAMGEEAAAAAAGGGKLSRPLPVLHCFPLLRFDSAGCKAWR